MTNFEIYNNIPEEMKNINRWVCLKMVDNGSKKIKMPVSAHSGKVASVTDEANWADFTTALNYYQEHKNSINGLGFVFSDTDDIVGIDFDNCLDTDGNLITDTIKEIISRNNSYIERSVSGSGLHIYLRGKLPTATGVKLSTEVSPHGFGIELYERKRFFIVTGNAYPDCSAKLPVVENQEFINYVLSLTPTPANICTDTTDTTINNEVTENLNALLEEKLANDNHFYQLWNGHRFKGDESGDDMALCWRLAQITTNPAEIQDLFLHSPLLRLKRRSTHKKMPEARLFATHYYQCYCLCK